MELLVLLAFVIFVISASYVAVCGLIYIIEEINSEIKNAKRYIRDTIWEFEWKWKMLKRRFKKNEI